MADFSEKQMPENLSLFAGHPAVEEVLDKLRSSKQIKIRGLAGSGRACVIAEVARKYPLLCIMDDNDRAGYFFSDLEQLMTRGKNRCRVLFFPSAYKRAIKYGHRDELNCILRAETLTALALAAKGEDPKPVIVTCPEAILEKVVSSQQLSTEMHTIHVGDTVKPDELRDELLAWGYERTDYVYEPGQFAFRGSIVDIFSFSSELPFRLDFFDDELESIRSFEPESQLSTSQVTQITLMPNVGSTEGAQYAITELLPKNVIVVTEDPTVWAERLHRIYDDKPAINDGEGFDSLDEVRQMLVEPDNLIRELGGFRRIVLNSPAENNPILFSQRPQPPFNKDFEALTEQIENWGTQGYDIRLSSNNEKQYRRFLDILGERSSLIPKIEQLAVTLHEGFIDDHLHLAVLTEHQVFGRYHKYNLKSDKARSGKVTLTLKELNSFNNGDYVVHSDHGIGRFGGLVTMDIGGKAQEVVKIIYRNNDAIFVSLHSLHKLSRYRGKDDGTEVTLSKLGSGAWQRIKDRAKKRVKDIARDLIKLYARRREEKGFSFSPDSYMQQELEASFVYEDTPDQAKATADVKADMESESPMDRLICGDVGFGKTEVAIRAAFKAAADSKQVAVLVPTTVLAYQHYQTFKERLSSFPVKIAYVSRARSSKEIRETLKQLEEGSIDIIIGTHRLTSKDVKFKDLGLLIIDEEQKFGVAVKEKLRKLQVNVDTLTMSATPIPRTLQFSLMGARDLSNITTPPSNRYPVETVLTRFSAETIREAINFELSRNGQIFFIHNRIHNIQEVAKVIQREIPDARVVIGHGQMPPAELEKIILDFVNHEYDVLIATTIIENGIDVPNANTIIINDAQRFGLSELHQLRGRVGRSNKKAYCYLLTPPLSVLSDDARRRVQAIESFSDLGSGIRIALQDLDIRGAGNILGAEQSGFIADMGYETYQKVFEEAVNELKTQEFRELYADKDNDVKRAASETVDFVVETQVESDLELSFAEEYVPVDAERILLYRELDNLNTDEELEGFRNRMLDRFGALPPKAEELILVPKLRRLGKKLGIEKISLRNGLMNLHLVADKESAYYQSDVFTSLLLYVSAHTRQCEIKETKTGLRIIRIKGVPSVQAAVEICIQLLETKVE